MAGQSSAAGAVANIGGTRAGRRASDRTEIPSSRGGAHMNFQLDQATTMLERTPALMNLWLRGLPQGWLDANEGPETWSPRDVIGHLIHGEDTDWIPRAQLILEHG